MKKLIPFLFGGRKLHNAIVLTLISCLLNGCYERKVNTLKTWCERLTEINHGNNSEPYASEIDREAIRDDFVKFLNDAYMEKVQRRAPQMVWRVGKVLHVVSLSSLVMLKQDDFVKGWKDGIGKAQSLQKMDDADNCLWETVFLLFDSVQIHLLTTDPVQRVWGDSVTSLPTRRKEIFAKYRIESEDRVGWYLLVPRLVEGPAIHPACQHDLVPDAKASLTQWSMEGSFDSAKECDTQQKQYREAGTADAAEATRMVSSYHKESPGEGSFSLPVCSGLARGKQLASAICVSADDPRLKENRTD